MRNKFVQYFVEGEDEEKLIHALKSDLGVIRPGKVQKLNVIPQVHNLEDELVRSCDIKKITELLNSRSTKDFKTDFIRIKNLAQKLQEHHFDINRLWCQSPESPYQNIKNQAEKIRSGYIQMPGSTP